MSLKWLAVHHFRNISEAGIELSPGVNLFHGLNGSGKTSILEAAYFLGMARSFRTPRIGAIIQHDQPTVTVHGELYDGAVSLGVSRNRAGQRTCRINGEDISELSRLTRLMPTLVMGPETSELVSGPPEGRRRFLNWGVFHVEHGFEVVWRNYARCLKQRNQLLKHSSDGSGYDVWDQELVRWGEEVDERRRRYFEQYQGVLSRVCDEVMPGFKVGCDYSRGWSQERSLSSQLEQDRARDQYRGQTHHGPHRADLEVSVNGEPASMECSRGEMKTLAWCMLIAQGWLQQGQRGQSGQSILLTYLVDDLISELDSAFSGRIAGLLARNGAQVLATGIEPEPLRALFSGHGVLPMFHVKQGAFHRVSK